MRIHKLLPTGVLALIGLAMAPLYFIASQVEKQYLNDPAPLGWVLAGLTILYSAACAFVWFNANAENRDKRQTIIQLLLIISIGMLPRILLWGLPPALSQDAYRYVWDAHQLAHGVSPYQHTPMDSSIAWLRDSAIWPYVNWRDAPTIYPPGAQFFFLLIYKIAPLNIFAMKAGIALCDIAAGAGTIMLLWLRGLDFRRLILYWWSPIPILEFAWSAHIDAAALFWTIAAVAIWQLRNHSKAPKWLRGEYINNALIGILLGLAALTKLYPILFAIVLWRRDKVMPLTLLGTIASGYLLLLPIGLGNGGFIGTYFSQRFVDQGLALRLLSVPVVGLGGSQHLLVAIQFILLGVLLLAIFWRQYHAPMSPDVGILVISAVWILLSPHLFPWYIAALLPFLAMARVRPFLLGMWIFALLMPFTYIIFAPGQPAWLFVFFFIIPGFVAITPVIASALPAQVRFSSAYKE